MFCPKCKTEYENWVKECADCKVPLLLELPDEFKAGTDIKLLTTEKPILRRVLAYIFDSYLITIIGAFVPFFNMIIFSIPFEELLSSGKAFLKIFSGIFPAVILGTILTTCKDLWGGASPGKRVFNIKVVNADNINIIPRWYSLITRNILLIIWPIEFFVMVLSQKGQRIGDKVAGTMVVLNRPLTKKQILLRIIVVILGILIFIKMTALSTVAIMKNSYAYREMVSYIKTNEQIQNEFGIVENFGISPTGNLRIEGDYGEATFSIKIINSKGKGYVDTYLTYRNRTWKVEMAQLRIGEKRIKLDI